MNAIGRRRLNTTCSIVYQKQKVCNMKIEIVTCVVNGSVRLTVTFDRQELIQVRSRCDALSHVFDLKFDRMHRLREDMGGLSGVFLVENILYHNHFH